MPASQASVMVVDDEKMNSTILVRRLNKKGFTVYEAYDGKEALDAIISDPFPDLVLMDLMMPIMDGWEATRQIKDLFPKCKVIAVSAKLNEADNYKKNGFDGFCAKPVDFQCLLEKIDLVLDGSNT